MMHAIVAAVSMGLILTGGTPQTQSECDAGYQTFLGEFTKLVHTAAPAGIAGAARKSVAVYDACKAGDDFTPAKSWNSILEELRENAAK